MTPVKFNVCYTEDMTSEEYQLLRSCYEVFKDQGFEHTPRLKRPVKGVILVYNNKPVVLSIDRNLERIETILTRLINLRVGLAYDGSTHYCGRKSSYKRMFGKDLSFLGNNHHMFEEKQRDYVIEMYRRDFERHHRSKLWQKGFKVILNDLEMGSVTLGCFCYPKRCHCDVIRQYLQHQVIARICQ